MMKRWGILLTNIYRKYEKKKKNIYLLYNGLIINEELTFNKCANNLDKSRNLMNVIVLEIQDSGDELKCMKKSKYIICPTCKESALISMEDYKIKIYGCKNGHIIDNIKIKDFEKTQYIEQSSISCHICNNLKSETKENKFFKCYTCKRNICPLCQESHDKSHYIIDYEQNIYYCNIHFNAYIYYCTDCKKDICGLCEKEHKNHNLISYKLINPDINSMKNELSDIKEKILKLKSINNNIISKLNNLNTTLDKYFDIYYNILQNFDINKQSYFSLKCINDMNKYNKDFLTNITEIINDNNFKTQFNDIIIIENKMANDKIKNTFINKEIFEEKIDNNKIIQINNNKIDDKKDQIDNIKEYNPLEDKYENFRLSQMKKHQTFTTKYKIYIIEILKDRRILTVQNYSSENGSESSKLIIYNTNNGFICDINHEIEHLDDLFEIDSGNLIIKINYYHTIKIIKVKKNSISEIFSIDFSNSRMYKLDNNKIIFKVQDNELQLYLYEKNKLTEDINMVLDEKESIMSLCKINEDEIGIKVTKEGLIFGSNDYVIFFHLKKNKKIKSLKVGKNCPLGGIFLINKDNILVGEDDKLIIIDTKSRNIKKEFKFEFYRISDFIPLNEKSFLIRQEESLFQFEFDNSNIKKLEEDEKYFLELIKKYPDNKILCVEKNTNIVIYG